MFTSYLLNRQIEIRKRSFSQFGVRLWNEILCCIRDLLKDVFKGEICWLLFNILPLEHDYIETPIMIQKIDLAY